MDFDNPLLLALMKSGGGGGGGNAAGIFDTIADAFALNSASGYAILSAMYLSRAAGDRITINGRWFERTDESPLLWVVQKLGSGSGPMNGYCAYTPTADGAAGTYSEYGDIVGTPVKRTTPGGHEYYVRRMSSPWGTSSVTTTVSNSGTTIATLANNGWLQANGHESEDVVAIMGKLMDALFFS